MILNPEIKEHLCSTPHPIIFEIGACNGNDVHRLNKIMGGTKATIYAWEANPVIIEFLKNEKPLPPNAILVEKAVSNEDGTAPFNVAVNSKNQTCGSSSLLKPKHSPLRPRSITFTEVITVPTQTLDSFCEEHGITHVDLVLADIQGAEFMMIQGGQETFKRTKYLSMELMPVGDYRYEGMFLGDKNNLDLLPEGWRLMNRAGIDIIFKNTRYKV